MASVKETGSLPIKKTDKNIDPWKASCVLHGPSGVGKTAFLAEFDNIFFIRTEERHKHVTIFEKLVTNWEEFTQVIELLEAGHTYRTIAVDTAPRLYDMCMTYMINNVLEDHPGALNDHGKSWKLVRDEFSEWVVRLMYCQAGVWWVCHTKTKEMNNSLLDGDMFSVDLPNQAYDCIIPLCDMTLFFGYAHYVEEVKKGRRTEEVQTTERLLVCQPRGDIEAKDSLGVLPPEINMGKRPRRGFRKFISYFKQVSKGE